MSSTLTRDYLNATTLKSEIASFSSPAANPELSAVPKVGDHFPESDQLPQLQSLNGKPVLITFLRHCGCPFAEKAFQSFRSLSDAHPDTTFIAISHSNREDTDEWVVSVGGTGDVEIVVDPERTLYAKWGLGFSSYWANIGPMTMWKALKLGSDELIYNRPTKSGYRWQTAGSFAVDVDGTVRWVYVSRNAPDIPVFEDGLGAVGRGGKKEKGRKGRKSQERKSQERKSQERKSQERKSQEEVHDSSPSTSAFTV
ncbi:uncharacterized protein DFL_006040 [Arthrobotrys flagrans]|uniref:Thioredoxin domain-containing protein n=1 Tax=Arthrobotrys flagrans TaxID=97331 RepID=A0A436ZZJ4_ARTFL|nr:hypothetical protein DFL_006040 [Arthrobotrys flagrans]